MANNRSRQQGRNRSETRGGRSHSQGHDEWSGSSRSGGYQGRGEGDEERFDRNAQGQGRSFGGDEGYGRQFESGGYGRGTQMEDREREFGRSGREEEYGGMGGGGGEDWNSQSRGFGGSTGSQGGRYQQSFRTQERYGSQERMSPQFGGEFGSQERGRFSGRGPKGYQRDDTRIQEDISEQLTRHPDIDPSEVEISVQDGEVTLTGTVDSKQAKRMIEDIVEQCSGVSDVQNQLRVENGSGSQFTSRGYQEEGEESEETNGRSRRGSSGGRSGGSGSSSRGQSTSSSSRQARNRSGSRSRQR